MSVPLRSTGDLRSRLVPIGEAAGLGTSLRLRKHAIRQLPHQRRWHFLRRRRSQLVRTHTLTFAFFLEVHEVTLIELLTAHACTMLDVCFGFTPQLPRN